MLQLANGKQQFLDQNGAPLAGGLVYHYAPGTTNPVATYKDSAGQSANTNPIQLDSRGQAVIWGAGTFRQVVTDAASTPIWDQLVNAPDVNAAASNLQASLAKFSGAAMIGLSNGRMLQQHLDILAFGVTDIEAPATAASVQQIIDSASGGIIRFHGAFTFDTPLLFRNNLIYEGLGVDINGDTGTRMTFTCTTDAVKIANPLNGSTSANIEIRGIWFYSDTLTVDSALLFDTASSVVSVRRCRFNSSGIGITLDQSELWDIELCSFNATTATATCIWLVNGPDKQIGSNAYFTNRIGVRSCDFNGAAGATGIRDDGGVAHTYENLSFNALGSHIIATGVNDMKIDGGEYEISSAQSIIIGLTKRKGTPGSKSTIVSINRVYLYNNVDQPVLAVVAGALGKLEFTNNALNTPAGTALSGLAVGCDEIDARGNVQSGTGSGNNLINNYIDINPAPVSWLADTTPPTIGNGVLVASYSRRGKLITERIILAFGSTTTAGVGGYKFPLQFPADPSQFSQLGAAYIFVPGVGIYTGIARVTSDGTAVQLMVTGSGQVGAASPVALGAGTEIDFQINYVTAAPI